MNHGESGTRRRRHQQYRKTTASAPSAVPIPAIAWNAKRTTFTGGRSAAGTESSPVIVAVGSCLARIDRA